MTTYAVKGSWKFTLVSRNNKNSAIFILSPLTPIIFRFLCFTCQVGAAKTTYKYWHPYFCHFIKGFPVSFSENSAGIESCGRGSFTVIQTRLLGILIIFCSSSITMWSQTKVCYLKTNRRKTIHIFFHQNKKKRKKIELLKSKFFLCKSYILHHHQYI